MKTLLTTLTLLAALSCKAQVGNAMLGASATLFTGSIIYYALGEPELPIEWNQNTANQYQNDLMRYRNTRTVSLIGSSALLVTSLFVKTWEVRKSERTSIDVSPNHVALTWKF